MWAIILNAKSTNYTQQRLSDIKTSNSRKRCTKFIGEMYGY